MKTLGQMAAALLLITAGVVYAEAGRLTVVAPESTPVRQLLGVNDADCRRVKGYLAQQECFAEQQRVRAARQVTVLQSDFTCERIGTLPCRTPYRKWMMSVFICISPWRRIIIRKSCRQYSSAIRCPRRLPPIWQMAASGGLVTADGWKGRNALRAAKVTACA